MILCTIRLLHILHGKFYFHTDIFKDMPNLYKYDQESEVIHHPILWMVISIWVQIILLQRSCSTFLVIKKVIFFMSSFVGAKEFVGGEITRREIKLWLQIIMSNLSGCSSANSFSQYPNARWHSWKWRVKVSIRGQKTILKSNDAHKIWAFREINIFWYE